MAPGSSNPALFVPRLDVLPVGDQGRDMSTDAAQPFLEGAVRPESSGGVIRYRLWPLKRHPLRSTLLVLVVIATVWGAWMVTQDWLWAGIAAVGCISGIGVGLFPTEVSLDSYRLNVRHAVFMRTWDLRRFRRMEVDTSVVPRVEFTRRARLNPIDRVRSVVLPLPSDELDAQLVVDHLRQFVGRQITGQFELDADLAPEDNV